MSSSTESTPEPRLRQDAPGHGGEQFADRCLSDPPNPEPDPPRELTITPHALLLRHVPLQLGRPEVPDPRPELGLKPADLQPVVVEVEEMRRELQPEPQAGVRVEAEGGAGAQPVIRGVPGLEVVGRPGLVPRTAEHSLPGGQPAGGAGLVVAVPEVDPDVVGGAGKVGAATAGSDAGQCWA